MIKGRNQYARAILHDRDRRTLSFADHYQQKTTIVANRIIILFKDVLRKSSVTKVIQYKLEYDNLTITIMCDLLDLLDIGANCAVPFFR